MGTPPRAAGTRGASLATAGVAGCLDRTTEETDSMTVHTSFFTLFDFTRNVAGDTLSVSNPVPAEQHGHGWEPSSTLLPEIVESDAFVYLGANGFQPWAEDVAAEIEENFDDVQLIDALEEIDLVAYESDHHEEYDHDPTDQEYGSVAELEVVDQRSQQVLVQYHFDHWHGELPTLTAGGHRTFEPRFIDSEDAVIALGRDEYRLAVGADDSKIVSVGTEGDQFTLEGRRVGEASITIELLANGERLFAAEPITVSVGEEPEAVPEPDHGLVDVKFFSDPVLAQQGVQTIRDGLIGLDPDNESVYRDNAAEYIKQLDALHQEFRAALADRDREQVLLAGHDSFQYLARRYGFEIETPVGLSPNDEPSTRDIAAAVDFAEENDITHVLWDYFDGERIAEGVVREAGTAAETAMVSAAESYVPEWKEAGHGDYLGQMREINIPAFKAALGAR